MAEQNSKSFEESWNDVKNLAVAYEAEKNPEKKEELKRRLKTPEVFAIYKEAKRRFGW